MADAAAVTALAQLIGRVNMHRDSYKLPNFSGRDNKTSSCKFTEWIYLYEQKVQANDDIVDAEKQRLVLQSLTGEARERYITLERSGATFENIVTKFKTVYSDQSSSIELIEAFHAAKQVGGESVSQFADRVELLAHKVSQHDDMEGDYYTSDELLKTKFVRGLKDESLADRVQHLLDDDTRTFDVVRRKVVAEDERRRCKAVKPVKAVADQSELMEARKRLANTEKELADLKRQVAQSHRKPNQKPQLRCEFCNRPGHAKPKCYAYIHQQELAKTKTQPGNA